MKMAMHRSEGLFLEGFHTVNVFDVSFDELAPRFGVVIGKMFLFQDFDESSRTPC